VEGDAFDANGQLVHVRIDEEVLLTSIIHFLSGNFTSTGEVLAAAQALKQGDPAPLLRLGAEAWWTSAPWDLGDPASLSFGAGTASVCADNRFPWDWSVPASERETQYRQAVANLPANFFTPFSKAAATGNMFNDTIAPGGVCLWWERPQPSSPVEGGTAYPDVPTLVLHGDMDAWVPVEEVQRMAALFPNATQVTVPEAGHSAVLWTHCAANMASEWIENLTADTTCAGSPETVYPAVGRFPIVAADAVPAEIDPNGGNQVGDDERRAVTVAVAAATDALQRSMIGSGDGVGLRGGTFHTDYGFGSWTTTITGCEFSTDVIVDGTITWGADHSLTADLTLSGTGTAGGTIHVDGSWQALGPVGDFTVSGTLGGLNVGLLVPEA
jgi:TAP-like protein